jgi:hypothetical protein
MYPLHDHDLDRLSREAAEHFEVEPGASGWEHLEKRLDQELPQKKKRRRFLFWLFFITATTGGALTGILTYKPVNPLGKNAAGVVSTAQKPTDAQQQPANSVASNGVENKPATGNESTPVAPGETITNPAPVANNQGTVAPSTVPAPTAPSKSNTVSAMQPAPASLATSPSQRTTQTITKAGNTQKSTPAPSELSDQSPLSLNYATITPANKNKNTWHTTKPSSNKRGKPQRTKAGQHTQTISPVPDNTTIVDAGITAKDQQQTIAESVEVNNEPSTPVQDAATPTDSAKNNAVAPPVTDSAKTGVKETPKKEDDPKKDKKEKGFELGLIAGPDVSAVKFGPLYKAGYNFGLQVGYRFSNRWSVNTGVIYTKKFYQADGEDFHYKNQWGTNYDKAEGNCSMWEIPVNVRYDVSFNTKRRWFVSTGLSTYLMDKEYYDLYYTWNGTSGSYDMDLDTNSNYFFSIWNLSVGMERSLGKRFSIQAEPYLKVPLQGLGKGTIRMDSYGIYFTLKFKPGFRTKKINQ